MGHVFQVPTVGPPEHEMLEAYTTFGFMAAHPEPACSTRDGSCDVGILMYMATRTQIYLTDEQRARLIDRADRQGSSMAQLVRDAVDCFLASDDDLDATFGTVPDLAERVPPRDEWSARG